MPSDRLRLLACQITIPPTPSVEERDRHVLRIAHAIETKCQDQPVDLIVLPELSAVDYSRQTFDGLSDLAESLDGTTVNVFSKLARRCDATVIFGMPRIGSDGGFHICHVAVGPDGGLLGHYDKLHIAQFGASMEKEYFTRGSHLFAFDVNGVKIAPIICYDIRVPELTRTLAVDHGVQLILHCGAYARDESFDSWHDFVVTRAVENQVFFLSLNRAGPDFGASLFCPPWIDNDHPPTRFPEHDEAFLVLDVDPDLLQSVRSDYTFLGDRLDNYSELNVLEG